MVLQVVQVNIKAQDDAGLGRFWADALDWGLSSEGPGVTNLEPHGFVWPDPLAVCIDLVSVPDPTTVHYRARLDLASESAEHHEQLVARLRASGATSADLGLGDGPFTTLADPEGNVFRVLEPHPLYDDTGPIAAVVVDCANPRAMARFWREAIDWTLHELTDEHALLRASEGVGPYLEFVNAPDPDSGNTRMHLDLLPKAGAAQAAEVARLRALGAAAADIGQGDVPWVVMADTEGNEFCVLAPR